ncbi:MAG TPA: amidohydrolase family protein [Firmicutes bacterium]|jgi:predicted TIM-barrel fold metal-dependent hydrolase|nr:amidohydrolase family protein [Bacillota bacterium]
MKSLIDTSVFVGNWPFQPLKENTCATLKRHLTSYGVTQAWVANVEAVLLPDPMYGNETLFTELPSDPFFVPVVIINPTLATWRADLQYCIAQGARAVKILPNYHQYTLDEPVVSELVQAAHADGLTLCVQMRITDERAHHPLMKVPCVPAAALAALAKQHPYARFLACAVFHAELPRLAGIANVWAELSHVESMETLVTALQVMGDDHLVFGSHSPFLYFKAVQAKLACSPGTVSEQTLDKVSYANAQTLLGSDLNNHR